MFDTKLFIIFIVCNIINVIIQTIKSIATIKCGKLWASIINAIAYGFYTYIVILMVCELPLLAKCITVGLCNLVGVFLVKLCEEKARKSKLWKIECTVLSEYKTELHQKLKDIPHNYVPVGEYTIFNIYSKTHKESRDIKKILDTIYKAKYFVSESKTLY